MRLLLVSHSAGPYGAEKILLALGRGLAERGHEVVLDFPHDGPAVKAAGADGLEYRLGDRHRLPRTVREGVGFFATGRPAARDAGRAIRQVDPDLVWINSVYNPWAALAAARSGRPVVWHIHEYRLPEPLGLATAALVGSAATRVVVVSRFLVDGWGRYPWLRRRLFVLSNPLLDELHPVQEPTDPSFTVGYVGQLEPRKRVPDLVRAVARLPEDVRAVIVGDGKARPATESAIRSAGVKKRVELTGYSTDIAARMARFHCVSIPSLREPFGLVALEAMAAGVPVVAARSGALPEVLGPAALYHAPRDPEDLARNIAKLRSDPTLRRELADRGLDRVNGFSRDAWLDDAEALARATIEEARGGI